MATMRLEDWSSKWRDGKTGWHRQDVHEKLVKHFPLIVGEKKDVTFFVPLCGKTKDLLWILKQGHRVVGVEFDETAIRDLFKESEIEITDVRQCGDMKLFVGVNERFKVYQGDIFKFRPEYDDQMEAIWDRGSLVAINKEDRNRYAALMKSCMSPTCQYLLATIEYDVSVMRGPPHSFTEEEILTLFSTDCNVRLIQEDDMDDPEFKKDIAIAEKLHLISPI